MNHESIEGMVSCGFLTKKKEKRLHHFIYYGGFLVLSGRGRYISQDGQEWELAPGDFVQRRPGVKHTTIVEGNEPWLEFYVCMGPLMYRTLGEMGMINTTDPILKTKVSPMMLHQCIQLLTRFKQATEKEVKHLLINIQSFLFHVNSLHQKLNITSHEDRCVELLCESLSHCFDKKIDLKKEAKNYNMSYEKLRKLFKDKIGVSPHQYFITKRINEAQSMLHDPSLSIAEIAAKLGFYDAYAFSNQFKKIVGISPKQFRDEF